MGYKMKKYVFYRSWFDFTINKVQELTSMIDNATTITRRTFLQHVDRNERKLIEKRLGYKANSKRGLTMADDYHVSYHSSRLYNQRVYFFCHSAIEYIFVQPLKDYNDWLAKYYPIPANKFEGDDIALINHCILKWKGLLDLSNYNLKLKWGRIVNITSEETILPIDGESCALCKTYYRRSDHDDNLCNNCPLAKSLGRPCDSGTYNNKALYTQAKDNPQLMIDALLDAREMVKKIIRHKK